MLLLVKLVNIYAARVNGRHVCVATVNVLAQITCTELYRIFSQFPDYA